MDDILWRKFFSACAAILGPGSHKADLSASWCSWTTFARLCDDAGYWTCGVPAESELMETFIADGGTWGQPFSYSQLAHIIIPAEFYWDVVKPGDFQSGYKKQHLALLSQELSAKGVPHRLTDRVLEIKLY